MNDTNDDINIDDVIPDIEEDKVDSELKDEDLFSKTNFLLRKLYPLAKDSIIFLESYEQISTELNIEIRDCFDHLAKAYEERKTSGYYLGRAKRYLIRAAFESIERSVEDAALKIARKIKTYTRRTIYYKILFEQDLPPFSTVYEKILKIRDSIYEARVHFKGKTIRGLNAGLEILKKTHRDVKDLEIMLTPDINFKVYVTLWIVRILWFALSMIISGLIGYSIGQWMK